MKKPSYGYVYVASVKNNPNLCEIGHTKKNPELRIAEIKTDYKDLGFDFELFYHCESPRPRRHENLCHEILADHNFSREIFSVTPEFGSDVEEVFL